MRKTGSRGSKIPRGKLEFMIGKSFSNKNAEMVIYCRKGGQAALCTKTLMDMGYTPPEIWIQNVMSRLETEIGQKIARAVMDTRRDEWWRDD